MTFHVNHADDSHEMSSLIFSKKKIYIYTCIYFFKVSSAEVEISALWVKSPKTEVYHPKC